MLKPLSGAEFAAILHGKEEYAMKFVMTYQISAADWEDAVARFLETGGLPSEGLTLHKRWHAASGRYGFLLLECEDISAVYRFAAEWHDLCDLEITPVLDDEEAAAVLREMQD